MVKDWCFLLRWGTRQGCLLLVVLFFFLLRFIYLRECKWVLVGGKGRKKLKQTPCWVRSPKLGLSSRLRGQTQTETKNQMLNWLTPPRCPSLVLFNIVFEVLDRAVKQGRGKKKSDCKGRNKITSYMIWSWI